MNRGQNDKREKWFLKRRPCAHGLRYDQFRISQRSSIVSKHDHDQRSAILDMPRQLPGDQQNLLSPLNPQARPGTKHLCTCKSCKWTYKSWKCTYINSTNVHGVTIRHADVPTNHIHPIIQTRQTHCYSAKEPHTMDNANNPGISANIKYAVGSNYCNNNNTR